MLTFEKNVFTNNNNNNKKWHDRTNNIRKKSLNAQPINDIPPQPKISKLSKPLPRTRSQPRPQPINKITKQKNKPKKKKGGCSRCGSNRNKNSNIVRIRKF